jgi:ATP-binding cassette subfamily B protein
MPDVPQPESDATVIDPARSGLTCLRWVAAHHGLPLQDDELPPAYSPAKGQPPDTHWLLDLAKETGLKGKTVQVDPAELGKRFSGWGSRVPVIARLNNGNFVLVLGRREYEGKQVLLVRDPMAHPADLVLPLTEEAFSRAASGEFLVLRRPYALRDETQPFGVRWFLPQIFIERANFRDVAVAAFLLHGLGLTLPFFLQLVIDRVVTHGSRQTLTVLAVGAAGALIFEAAFQYLRQVILLDASRRIDLSLVKQTFSKLLALPMAFFEQGSAGVIVRNMQQAEKIRQFLTGKLFTTALDASVLIVFLPILLFYSVHLTLIVALFALAIGSVVAILVVPFRSRLLALYKIEGERQALLVETIQGMRTVKSLAVEPLRRATWEDLSEEAIDRHLRVGRLSATAHAAVSLLEKLMQGTIIALGAGMVIDHQLSLGALIAFQMLSYRVVSPLVQIISLVHEYQETALSVRMLGTIMNSPSEGRPVDASNSSGATPVVKGRIEFDSVSFRYRPDAAPALDHVTFTLPAGKLVGVVGKSGSGKSTLTRILQGFYPPTEGLVKLDGIDLREIDIGHLRRNIGMVLQESFLFRGTVRENIAIAQPDASAEAVVRAAQLSGALEFIERLPQGMDTLLEEGGSNLSGGQRQRLAIARALLPEPRILVLDEAASALDPESEGIFLQNLSGLAAGRTVIIVSHRLSTLTGADAIMVFDRGRIIDAGKHAELLPRCALYARLWKQQSQHLGASA